MIRYLKQGKPQEDIKAEIQQVTKIVTGIMARRARQHPMDFGHASTFAELVKIPEIQQIAEKFLSLIDYYGICEVEFIQDPRDGKYKLIEVNPRVWGWHTLAIAAGVDLPYLETSFHPHIRQHCYFDKKGNRIVKCKNSKFLFPFH